MVTIAEQSKRKRIRRQKIPHVKCESCGRWIAVAVCVPVSGAMAQGSYSEFFCLLCAKRIGEAAGALLANADERSVVDKIRAQRRRSHRTFSVWHEVDADGSVHIYVVLQ